MVAIVGLAVLLRRGWRMALRLVAPLAAIYLIWFVAFGPAGKVRQVGSRHKPTLGGDVQFMLNGYSRTIGDAGHFVVLGWLLLALLVSGGVLAWRQRRGTPDFALLAAPSALLIGSIGFLIATAVSRASFGPGYASTSRYVSVTAALLLPALAVAADAIGRRRRAFVPVAVVLLLLGVPGGLAHVGIAQTRLDPFYIRTKLTILSAARDPIARQVPPTLRPEQLTARDVTVGWLLQGVQAGRIPPPRKLIIVDLRASSDFRLTFFQSDANAPTTRCTTLTRPTYLRLLPGEVIGVYDNPVKIIPVTQPALVGFAPFFTPSEGHAIKVLRPVRPVVIYSYSSASGRVCVPPGAPAPHPYAPGRAPNEIGRSSSTSGTG
jgi:hypothetical protein